MTFRANTTSINGPVPQANTMYHIFAVYKPSQYLKLVSNGITHTITSSIPASIIPDSSHPLTIGRTMYYASTFYQNNMKLARVYNRALTDAEILQNYQAGYAYTPQIGARELISITKPIVSSVSRIGTGARTTISTVSSIVTDLSRVGMGNRELISTVEPITSSLSRIGIGSREVITQINPITTGISKLLPPIKCNLSLAERLGAINTAERLAKIEVI